MKVTHFLWILVLLAPCTVAAQSSATTRSAKRTVILEVAAEDFDIAWRQGYLYLKVLSDGTAECQVVKRKSGDHRFEKADVLPVKGSLSAAEFQQLQTLLTKNDILHLDTSYKQRTALTLDAGTTWRIQIPRSTLTQKIHVVAFAPDSARALRQPYPNALVALGCTIEKIRGEVTGENIASDDECRKVLPLQ